MLIWQRQCRLPRLCYVYTRGMNYYKHVPRYDNRVARNESHRVTVQVFGLNFSATNLMRLVASCVMALNMFYHIPKPHTPNRSRHIRPTIRGRIHDTSHVLIFGDFNSIEINRCTKCNLCATKVNENHRANKFLETIRDNYLYHHVKHPTRY